MRVRVPQMKRTEAIPKPWLSMPDFAAAISSGWFARPVVVGAEVNDVAVADGDVRLLSRSNDTFFFKQPFRARGIRHWLTVCRNHHALQLSRFGKIWHILPKAIR